MSTFDNETDLFGYSLTSHAPQSTDNRDKSSIPDRVRKLAVAGMLDQLPELNRLLDEEIRRERIRQNSKGTKQVSVRTKTSTKD